MKFVRLNVRLKEILGQRDSEVDRQRMAEKFRDAIASCSTSYSSKDFRIIVKKQMELWDDGVRAAQLFELQKQRDLNQQTTNNSAGDINQADDDDEGDDQE